MLSAHKYDMVFIEKELLPYLPGFLEWLLHRSKIKYILDYDDALFHQYDQSRSLLIRILLGGKHKGLITRASAVVCGNQYIFDYCEQYNANCVIINTATQQHTKTSQQTTASKKHKEKVHIGWIGSYTTSNNLKLVYHAINRILKEFPRVSCSLVGASTELQQMFEPIGVTNILWSPEHEIEFLSQLDIGLAPLYDTAFHRGKSAFKIVQYKNFSVATIASPVGANSDVVRDGVDGLFANTKEEWYQRLRTLIVDQKLRETFQNNAHESFIQDYATHRVTDRYAALFSKTLAT